MGPIGFALNVMNNIRLGTASLSNVIFVIVVAWWNRHASMRLIVPGNPVYWIVGRGVGRNWDMRVAAAKVMRPMSLGEKQLS